MTFEEQYKEAIELIGKNIKQNRTVKKPLIPHLLRVGKYLYENGYSKDIVNAGLLHDLIEWTDNPKEIIRDKFGISVYNIVIANTKDLRIKDAAVRREDYVARCFQVGLDALIVKAADVLDSFQYYQEYFDLKELERCRHLATLLLSVNIDDDPIFSKLKEVESQSFK